LTEETEKEEEEKETRGRSEVFFYPAAHPVSKHSMRQKKEGGGERGKRDGPTTGTVTAVPLS